MQNAEEGMTERVVLRLTPTMKLQLVALSAKRHQTVSEYVRWLVEREAKKL